MVRVDRMTIDAVARVLAANAGIVWETLNDHPGYARNQWREQARAVIDVMQAHSRGAMEEGVPSPG